MGNHSGDILFRTGYFPITDVGRGGLLSGEVGWGRCRNQMLLNQI